MKKWFDYQMINQVKNHDWDQYSTPVTNVNHLFRDEFKSIKENYRKGLYWVNFTRFFSDEAYYSKAGGKEIDRSDLYDMVNDPEFQYLMDHNRMHVFSLAPEEDVAIRHKLEDLLGLERDGSKLVVHAQEPGHMISLHIDRIRYEDYTGIKNPLDQEPIHLRYLTFFDDWQWGQFFQLGTDLLKWHAGDIYTWHPRDVPHGSCNVGYETRFLLCLTGKKIYAKDSSD